MSAHRKFIREITRWYESHKRALPWRGETDPYRIWLSEIMLQQTRVEQGTPYYLRFIDAFPTVDLLARASEEAVLRLWQGLGYYSRARNLHRCAKIVTDQKSGAFPRTAAELRALPGIGPYTAAAISSICFGEYSAVVDGNVFRVLARVFGIRTDTLSPAGKKEFQMVADTLMDSCRGSADIPPGEYNQALMEFGAVRCTPKNPACDGCPLSSLCVARAQGLQAQLPVRKKTKAKKKRFLHYVMITDGVSVAMRKREEGDIWQGLYDFPCFENRRPVASASLREWLIGCIPLPEEAVPASEFEIRHLLSHQELHARFFKVTVRRMPAQKRLKRWNWQAYPFGQCADLPKPVIIAKALERLLADTRIIHSAPRPRRRKR